MELPEENADQIDYIYEQPPEELLRTLLPRYVEMEFYRAMLESISAYHAARMTAMDAASSNAGDVISDLTLTLNRVRQASITREIIEIVSGAAAQARKEVCQQKLQSKVMSYRWPAQPLKFNFRKDSSKS